MHLISGPKDRTTYYYYDDLGRVTAKINGERYAQTYAYDGLGNLIKTVKLFNKASVVLSGDWDTDKPIADRKDIFTYSLYDASGLKVGQIDAEGYLTEYWYNETGLLASERGYARNSIKGNQQLDANTLQQIRPQQTDKDHTDHLPIRQFRAIAGNLESIRFKNPVRIQ